VGIGRGLALATAAVALASVAVAACGSASSGEASLTVYVSAPLSGQDRGDGDAFVAGARSALDERGGEAGGYPVKLVPLDFATPPGGYADAAAAANARTATADSTAIAYIGELDRTTRSSLPITREARLLQVEPEPESRPMRAGREAMESVLGAIDDAGDPLDRGSVAAAESQP
jgi:hypothetical protein